MKYRVLLAMAALSFASMYVLMYAMVDRFANVYPNVNQFYMAGLMTAPMIVIELTLMRSMYKDKPRNLLILGISVAAGIAFFLGIRKQTAVGDAQFLKSMIPHHASALLMCEEASITDPEIRKLCEGIRKGQQAEIDQMEAILTRLDK
jgi:uncharacterized protein (DUF305 family)